MSTNWSTLSHLDRDEIAKLQNAKLSHYFRHELPYSPYYRRLFAERGLRFDAFNTTDDLKKLPFTSKEDVAPTVADPAKPRQFILQPDEHLLKQHAPKSLLAKLVWGKLTHADVKADLEQLYKPIHMHFTTGRTALPTPFTYSASDLEQLKESGRRMLNVIGASRDLMALNGFPYSPHLAFWLCFFAMTSLGLTSLQTGGGKIMGTQKIIDALERLKVSLAAFIPGYAYHLFRTAAGQHRNFSSLEYLISGGERMGPGLRDKLRDLLVSLGAPHPHIFATYALTEGKTAWIQCHEESGYHLYPDMEFFEVVNKDGERVADGQPGELVYTSLSWRGSAVVRYRTGDLTQGIETGPCAHCGRTVPRIRPDIQRVSEFKEFRLTKVKGELVNLNSIYPLFSGMKEIEEWQVVISKKNNDPFEVDEVTVAVAPAAGVSFATLKPVLAEKVRSELSLSAEIVEAPLAALLERLGMETELKEKRGGVSRGTRSRPSGPAKRQ